MGNITKTSRGKPVAATIAAHAGKARRAAAKTGLLARLDGQKISATGNWTRGELYERNA